MQENMWKIAKYVNGDICGCIFPGGLAHPQRIHAFTTRV